MFLRETLQQVGLVPDRRFLCLNTVVFRRAATLGFFPGKVNI